MADIDSEAETRRVWTREDRAKISLMHVFRSHFEESRPVSKDGSEARRIAAREGITDTLLRNHIEAELSALLSTVRLDACFQEQGGEQGKRALVKSPWHESHPHLARSILNYGFCDLSDVTEYDLQKPDLVRLIHESLVAFEPRLIAETIKINVRNRDGGRDQRISLFVEADMTGDPVDIPIDFDAEVDLGAGKMRMSGVRVQL